VETLVVVGSGCSGTLVATHVLSRPAGAPVHVILIGRDPIPGRGVAYGTPHSAHLLNVPAGSMSAFPDRPEHFAEWVRRQCPELAGERFLPRALYARYLRWVLGQAVAAARPGCSFEYLNDEVISIEDDRRGVRLASGGRLAADRVVLALGNFAPPNPPVGTPGFYRSARYTRDPWAPGALDDLSGPVVLIGTGLTAVDVALALADRGPGLSIDAVSRRGLLPGAHRACEAAAVDTASDGPLAGSRSPSRTIDLLRDLRTRSAAAADWREVVDAVRPRSAEIWRSLPHEEQARFIRHTARYWDIHRHRMAPVVAARIAVLMDEGSLRVSAGTIDSFEECDSGVDVRVRRPGSSTPTTIHAAQVINCTGPQPDVTAVGDPLLDTLLVSGQARPGPFRMGIDADLDGRVIDASGRPSDSLWALGPLRKGVLWETTAVPEIRCQAAALAALLTRATPARGNP
jgi:uncharacterized NAD(P)/FAD-binding protein YdhS